MADNKLPLLIQAGVPGAVAAVLQFAMALAIGKIPPAYQMVGAVIVAALVGGGVSLICVEGLHLSSVISGIIGSATGAVPAVFWASVAQTVARQQVKQRFGVDEAMPSTAPAPPASVPAAAPAATPDPASAGGKTDAS